MTRLDGWEWIGIPGKSGGTYADFAAPWRGVEHSTEGNSIEGAVATYRDAGVPPQTTIDPAARRKAQHIDLDRSGYALAHPKGTPETNRLPCIQVEIVMYADRDKANANGGLYVGDLTDAHYAFIGECIREIEAVVPIPHEFHRGFVHYPDSYGLHAPQRMSWDTWYNFSGWCGHQHVPGNVHGDPGEFDPSRLTQGDDDMGISPDDWATLNMKFAEVHNHQTDLEAQVKALADGQKSLTTSKVAEIQRNVRRIGAGLDAAGTRILGLEGKVDEYPTYNPK